MLLSHVRFLEEYQDGCADEDEGRAEKAHAPHV